MSRDWDKLKRQDRARKQLLPKKRHRKQRPIKLKTKLKTSCPDQERILRVDTNPPSLSRWRRTNGQWRCLGADPAIEWFIRVRHLEVIEDWLYKHHLSFKWSKATPVCTAHKQTEDTPAEAYTPNQASVPLGSNTVTSLNNPSPDSVRAKVCGYESGLVRTGLNQSLPLNKEPNIAQSC